MKIVNICLPFTCFTFTITIAITKEILSIEAGDLFSHLNVSQHLHARSVPPSCHKLKHNVSTIHNFLIRPHYKQRSWFNSWWTEIFPLPQHPDWHLKLIQSYPFNTMHSFSGVWQLQREAKHSSSSIYHHHIHQILSQVACKGFIPSF